MDENPFAPPAPLEPEPITDIEALPLADPGTRFGARVVDNLLAAASAVPGFVVYLLLGVDDPAWMGLCIAPLYLAFVGYQWYLTARDGATLGKRWSHIRIVREDGRPIDFLRGVVLRSWVLNGIVTVVGAALPLINVVGLVDALMVFTHNHRTLHDHIAGTRVVRVRRWEDLR